MRSEYKRDDIGKGVRGKYYSEYLEQEKAMNLKQIEEEALHLSQDERAELAQKLLLSMDEPTQEEIEEDWLVEARRRAKELDEGTVQPISSEDVRKKARALLGGS